MGIDWGRGKVSIEARMFRTVETLRNETEENELPQGDLGSQGIWDLRMQEQEMESKVPKGGRKRIWKSCLV